jgi:hypothetical protein
MNDETKLLYSLLDESMLYPEVPKLLEYENFAIEPLEMKSILSDHLGRIRGDKQIPQSNLYYLGNAVLWIELMPCCKGS